VSGTICLGWPATAIVPTSASQVARFIGTKAGAQLLGHFLTYSSLGCEEVSWENCCFNTQMEPNMAIVQKNQSRVQHCQAGWGWSV
jgi:hypothetical protein